MTEALSFDFTRAHARRSDPETSHLAAASISSKRLSQTKNRILTLLQGHGSMTDEWLCRAWREEFPDDFTSDQSIRSRRAWLVQNGYVEFTHTWGETQRGLRARKWKLTTKGQLAL